MTPDNQCDLISLEDDVDLATLRAAESPSPAPTIKSVPRRWALPGSGHKTHRTSRDRFDDQLRQAGSLQRSLQSPPPAIDGLDVHTLYRPAGAISGDLYDVVRLDETHVSLALADATGHDLAAGLLSVFIKRSLQGKEHRDGGYRLLDPDEVLARANRDLLAVRLEECQFVTAVYAVYNEQTHVIRWARGGGPYPILMRRNQPPRLLISEGTLLGAVPNPTFEVVEHQLEPGDTLILHTDGLEDLVRLRTRMTDRPLSHTVLFPSLGDGDIETHLHQLTTELNEMDKAGWDRDDVTVVTLTMNEQASSPHGFGQGADQASSRACAPAPL